MKRRKPWGSVFLSVERLEGRRCPTSWFGAVGDDSVVPLAIAQYDNPAQIAVLGSAAPRDGTSVYDEGIALQLTPTGISAREVLMSIDPSRPVPSGVHTRLRDAEFMVNGSLVVVGGTASDRAAFVNGTGIRLEGEPSEWSGNFGTGFSVAGLGFPNDTPSDGAIRAFSARNGGVAVGEVNGRAVWSFSGGQTREVLLNGLPVRGLGLATNGERIVVADALNGKSYYFTVSATGELGPGVELQRPDDVFNAVGFAVDDNNRMSGFGEVYDLETATTHSVVLIWNADGSLAKRIDRAGQNAESRLMVDGAVFFDVFAGEQALGSEGSYVYLMDTDTVMPVVDWATSLGISTPGFTLNSDQIVRDAEWSQNGLWLNLLVDSATGPDFVIHIEGLTFAPGGDTGGDGGDDGDGDDDDGDTGGDDDGGSDEGGENGDGTTDEGDLGGNGSNNGNGNTGGNNGGGNTGGNNGGGTNSGNGEGNNGGGNTGGANNGGNNGGNAGGGNTGGNTGGSGNGGGGVVPPGDTGGNGGNTGGQTGNSGNPGPNPGGNSGSSGGGSTDVPNQGGSSTGNGSGNGAVNGGNNGGGRGGNTSPRGGDSGRILDGIFGGIFVGPGIFDDMTNGRNGGRNSQPNPPVQTPSQLPSRGPLPAQAEVREQPRQGNTSSPSFGGGGDSVLPQIRRAPSLTDVLGWLFRKVRAIITLDLSMLEEPMPRGEGKEQKPVSARERSQADTPEAPANEGSNEEAPDNVDAPAEMAS